MLTVALVMQVTLDCLLAWHELHRGHLPTQESSWGRLTIYMHIELAITPQRNNTPLHNVILAPNKAYPLAQQHGGLLILLLEGAKPAVHEVR